MKYLIQLLPIVVLVLFVFLFLRSERRKNKYSPFTEKILRLPGHTLQAELDSILESVLLPFLLVLVIPLTYVLKWDSISGFFHIVHLVIVFATVIYAVIKLKSLFKKAWNIRLGLEGEIYTGQELNYLMREGAWVYHDIPYKYGNIDHIIVSSGGVFVIETKAVRKPAGKNSRTEYKVAYENGCLKFPHVTTKKPLNQAKRHADYLSNYLKKHTKLDVKVTPVVALPGWYVDLKKGNGDVMVVNPKRGLALSKHVKAKVISDSDASLIAEKIETYARDVISSTEMSDPDGAKKYDFFNNRKNEKQHL